MGDRERSEDAWKEEKETRSKEGEGEKREHQWRIEEMKREKERYAGERMTGKDRYREMGE